MSQELTKRLSYLRDRADMLARSRQFFHARKVLEVDCPILSHGASIDAHIDLIPAIYNGAEECFLHSSPEYGMKRLLAEGIGDIYQLSHVFRDGECGRKHNPEFMMAEWYRVGFSFEQMIAETLDYIRLFVGDLPSQVMSYRETVKTYAGIDYVTASEQELFQKVENPYSGLENEGKDSILNMILGNHIEPRLGQDGLFVLAYYPSTQAALAQTKDLGDEKVAERFEVYYKGVELANGYHELVDASEQRERFHASNRERAGMGKRELPLDEYFLAALEKGLPDSCGVAVGFDRLMMLRHGEDIQKIIPHSWNSN